MYRDSGYIKKAVPRRVAFFIAIMVTSHRVLSHCTLAPKEARLCGCPLFEYNDDSMTERVSENTMD